MFKLKSFEEMKKKEMMYEKTRFSQGQVPEVRMATMSGAHRLHLGLVFKR